MSVLASFVLFITGFLAIGLLSSRVSTGERNDYYLASRSVSPLLTGLSAVATNNSGYMFIGVIGYTYSTGLPSIWLMIGWILGDFVSSTFVHRRLRVATANTNESSYAAVLSNWQGQKQQSLQRTIGLVALVFLLAYASAQLVAGSKALNVLLGWPTWVGAAIGAIMIAMYCMAGGIRASIWTDAAQSVVMILAMLILLIASIVNKGGVSSVIGQLEQIPNYMNWVPSDLLLPGVAGGFLFIVSWGFAGLSVIGQPHVMIRFMALDKPAAMVRARCWYYLWFTAFYSMATAVGLVSRLYFGETAFDAELALPMMAQTLLPDVLVGLMLAGIFAATMSTADSLVLSCSATLTQDMLPRRIESPWVIKGFTFAITALALLWALVNQQSVFNLVIMSWSGMASAFAPLLIVLALGGRPSQVQSVVMLFTGLGTALLWRYLGWQVYVYEGMPGIIVGLLMFVILSRVANYSTHAQEPLLNRQSTR
jgi:SSS family transporter